MDNLYCLGHFGTGNLGDEAIFSGMVNVYGTKWKIIQIYAGVPTYYNNYPGDRILNESFSFQDGRLILGGGGIPHNESVISKWLPVMKKALDSGLQVTIEGIGLETCPVDLRPKLLDFLAPASKVTVRSQRSLDILQELGYTEASMVKDFAYYLKADTQGAGSLIPEFRNELPILGIVSGTQSVDLLAEHMDFMTKICNVLYIPQVHHTISVKDNGVITGERIWSMVNYSIRNNPGKYKCLPFPETPEILLGVYKFLDGIIATRLHSFILAELANIKVIVMSHGTKIEAYLEEHPSDRYIDGDTLKEKVENFSTRAKDYDGI